MTDAIDRCREAIHDADDMLAVATRDDFAALLDAYDTLRLRVDKFLTRFDWDGLSPRAEAALRELKELANP